MIATVTEPVYDSATGEHLLIPQGSRMLGRYNSQVSYGQSKRSTNPSLSSVEGNR